METGTSKAISYTLTVANRPRAEMDAAFPPSRSICYMIQSPDISPLPLASAGIVIGQMVGSMPAGRFVEFSAFVMVSTRYGMYNRLLYSML